MQCVCCAPFLFSTFSLFSQGGRCCTARALSGTFLIGCWCFLVLPGWLLVLPGWLLVLPMGEFLHRASTMD